MLVNWSIVSRMLKRRKWTWKGLQCVMTHRNDALQRGYRLEMAKFVAEDLVFFDESIFNEKTGWRYCAYGSIGSLICYPADIRRGRTWSICAATTISGWLSCTGIKEGYFKLSDLFNWLKTGFLPTLRIESGHPHVIMLDNCSTHVNEIVISTIETEGHVVYFLPPYSLDFNPIELCFSVLKAWLQRNYIWTRHRFENFGGFLS